MDKGSVMSKTQVSLFRSVTTEQFPEGTIINEMPAPGVLYPDFEPRILPNGTMRRADVSLSKDKLWVKPGGGTSLFDRDKVFKSKKWQTFPIPKETIIPESLTVRFTRHNKQFNADHYQIECNNPMQIQSFKGALDNFARNAVVKFIEMANK